MKKVTILALEQALGASVMGPMDIFCLAGLTWNYIFGREIPPIRGQHRHPGRPAGNQLQRRFRGGRPSRPTARLMTSKRST